MQVVQIDSSQFNEIIHHLVTIEQVLNSNFTHLLAFMLFLSLLVVFLYFFSRILLLILHVKL